MRLAIALALTLAACAPAWKNGPHDQLFQYEQPRALMKAPPEREISDWWDYAHQIMFRPLGRALSPGTYAAVVVGGRDARDVNDLGQVPDSGWFENRIGRRTYTADQAFTGAAAGQGLAPGPLSVISGKIDGVSAGFIVRDAADQIWYLKLDHPAFPELATSAEVISSRLLWLAGYHVPAMLAVDLEPSRFWLDPRAKTKDKYGRKIQLTQDRLDELLANTNPDLNGRVRVLISRQPPGEVLGPFDFAGRRSDDPNDTIDHEHRRSLRGLWLFSAWLNNTDTRQNNSLDMFRRVEGDRGLIDHYLIDFGDSFGSAGLGEKAQVEGWAYLLDWATIMRNILSLGIGEPVYATTKRSAFRTVGLFDAKQFDPDGWKAEIPNPAFDQRTDEDLFWAGSILARIQPDHIRAAVSAGHYEEEGAAAYIIEVLLGRRKKMLEYAFGHFLELDRPRMDGSKLTLDDLRVLGQLPTAGAVSYVVTWTRTRAGDVEVGRGKVESETPALVIDLGPALAAAKARAGFAEDPFVTVSMTRYGESKMDVHLRVNGDRATPIAIDR